ncbi:hypothetical protein EAI_04799 [Harpegnathos saltator]|uniref:Uncharacterized protein n=1 Tax=Harpegnathos saltator TaxID=610380 RepID=E2BHG1_HARSA|nr:hypothetical protein EAI_04799 [Harpegnathos saltator]
MAISDTMKGMPAQHISRFLLFSVSSTFKSTPRSGAERSRAEQSNATQRSAALPRFLTIVSVYIQERADTPTTTTIRTNTVANCNVDVNRLDKLIHVRYPLGGYDVEIDYDKPFISAFSEYSGAIHTDESLRYCYTFVI